MQSEEGQSTFVQDFPMKKSECSSICDSEMDIETAAANSAEKPQLSKDPNIVNWNGDDDPEMALNWSARRKWTYIIMLALLTLLTCVDSIFFPHLAAD
jgi:hypothetical protein